MTEKGLTISSALPDWLTVTTVDHEETYRLFDTVMHRLMAFSDESAIKPWKAMGYIGHQCNGVKIGIRKRSEAILMISGKPSAEWANILPMDVVKVTRFDVQVTINIEPSDTEIARKEHTFVKQANLFAKRQRYIKLIESPTGSTLYVGKRTGAIVLRLYDKTNHYHEGALGEYWRYEVEFKKEAAQRAYDKWAKAPLQFVWCVQQVLKEFTKRGIDPGFKAGSVVNAIETKVSRATDEGRLQWLQKCVSPVVMQLCYAGHSEKVVETLRLRHIKGIQELI